MGDSRRWLPGCGHKQTHVALPTEAEEFVMVPLHSAPHDAVAEIDALYDVYLAVVNKWGTDVSAPAAPSPLWPRLLPGQEGMATRLGGHGQAMGVDGRGQPCHQPPRGPFCRTLCSWGTSMPTAAT